MEVQVRPLPILRPSSLRASAKNCMFLSIYSSVLAGGAYKKTKVERLAEDLYKVSVVVSNKGYKPTSGSQQPS